MTAILIAADGTDWLRPTLAAVAAQTRAPDRLVVVQLGDDARTTETVRTARPTAHLHVGARASFGEAVAAGVAALAPAGRGDASDAEWYWLLASDTAPLPDALERLVHVAEASPSVAIAGPKQMQWEAPDYLHAYGETMTRFGTAVELAEPELDQAQYDHTSDVLGVAAGGMFISGRMWRTLGGFDPALPAVDDALDLCIRCRLAGARVQLVPSARVRAGGPDAPGTAVLGASSSDGRRARLQRQAQLHRRLAYAPPAAAPLHWLSIPVLGVLRALGALLSKRPGSAPAELAAAVIVFATCWPGVLRARRRIARSRTTGWKALAPLRLTWTEVRHRRALLRDNGRPLTRRTPLRFVSGGGAATVLVLAAVGAVAFQPLIGAPALTGGALLPLGDLHSLWRAVGWGWHPIGSGFSGPADPFALVVALLGTLTFWHPSAAVVVLWVAALPLAALGGWLAAAEFTRRAPLRVAGGVLWAAAPPLVAALDAGRIAGVLVHLAAPFALIAAFRVRASWAASATLALLGALLAACSPSLLPVLAAAWVAAVAVSVLRPAADERTRIARILPLPLPTVVLFAPLIVVQQISGRPLAVLADPGPAVPPPSAPHLLGLPDGIARLLQLGAGWPDRVDAVWQALAAPLGLGPTGSALLVWALTLPLLLLAATGVLWPRRTAPLRVAIAGVAGLVAAVLATRLAFATVGSVAVPAWPGAGLSLAWLGVLEAAVCGLDRLAAGGELPSVPWTRRGSARMAAHLRTASAAVIGLAAAAAVLTATAPLLGSTLLGSAAVRGTAGATVPALVAAEGQTAPGLGMLQLTPQADGGVRQRLTRGTGQTLEQQSTLATTGGAGSGADLARLSASLVQPAGTDVGRMLSALQVGYVLLAPGDASSATAAARARAASALGSSSRFATVSTTASGTLYRFVDLPRGAGATIDAGGPTNTGTPIGLIVLGSQALVLGLTLLLALPTGRIATRMRPEPVRRPPLADVAGTRAAEHEAREGAGPGASRDRRPVPDALPERDPAGAASAARRPPTKPAEVVAWR